MVKVAKNANISDEMSFIQDQCNKLTEYKNGASNHITKLDNEISFLKNEVYLSFAWLLSDWMCIDLLLVVL